MLKRADDPWWTAWRSFTIDLKSTGRTQTTVDVYREAAKQFHTFLADAKRSTGPSVIDKQDVQEYRPLDLVARLTSGPRTLERRA